MSYFSLPESTIVNRVIPKNAFDSYTNTNQKKRFTNLVQRIIWTHKLSFATTNLDGKEISEIQVFKVELKTRAEISKILAIINKSIPYHIIFWIEHGDEAYLSAASKHINPINDDTAVVDWNFESDWFHVADNQYQINLRGSLDDVFRDLCISISGRVDVKTESIGTISENEEKIYKIKKEIALVKSKISKTKQFNHKVELNKRLMLLKKELAQYT